MSEAPRQHVTPALAALGLSLSIALERVHFLAYTAPSANSFCSAGPSFDCGAVALSHWSVLLGVPVPVWGIAGFLALTLLAWWQSRWLLPLSALAALSSLVLLGIELFSIHSVCLLCEGVHLTSFLLLWAAYKYRNETVDVDGMTHVHLLTVPVGLVIIARLFLAPYWAVFSWEHGVALPHGVDAEEHPWIGAKEPKVVVHEYTDYGCPHCAAVTSRVRQLLAKHPSKLRIVHHQYPRMRCPKTAGELACLYARASICAQDQGKFWEMDSWLYANAPGKPSIDLAPAGPAVGLDVSALKTCMDDPKTWDRADAEEVTASKAHVIGTPTYFIDGKRYQGGEVLTEIEKRL
jgi:uncharacterized membrane protein